MALTTAQRALYGRIGAAIARSRHRPEDLTAEGRHAFLARFEKQVRAENPDLPEPEMRRRAAELRRAHMLTLAVKASIKRAQKKAAADRKPAAADGSNRDVTTTDQRSEL